MRKWALGIMVGLVFFSGLTVAAEKKFAVVDVQKAMRSADTVKEIEAKLKKEFTAEEKKVETLKNKINELKERQKRDWAIMGDAEKRKFQEEGMNVTNELKALSQESQRRLQARQQELLQPVLSDTQEVIKDIMKEDGYDVVFRREALVEFNPKMDITLKVTLKLNEKSQK
ncbi:MAG: OmpH family outer membrane protein [Gammaproteobacteria bacterium]|nr:OmpH family outer membrane protein [Gammaproteobacteria bacterium]